MIALTIMLARQNHSARISSWPQTESCSVRYLLGPCTHSQTTIARQVEASSGKLQVSPPSASFGQQQSLRASTQSLYNLRRKCTKPSRLRSCDSTKETLAIFVVLLRHISIKLVDPKGTPRALQYHSLPCKLSTWLVPRTLCELRNARTVCQSMLCFSPWLYNPYGR